MNKIIIGLILGLMLISPALATEYTCSTCDECELAITNANDFDTVKLTADIIGEATTCINNPTGFNNIIFDCGMHTITGDGGYDDYGINIITKQNNTIQNCIIGWFGRGINIATSSKNNTVYNNTLGGNSFGVYIEIGLLNNIINNTANSNTNYGLYIDRGNNTLVYNNTVKTNNYGMSLYKSYHSIVSNNTANSNTQAGIYITSGAPANTNYTIENNTANSNIRGLYLLQSTSKIRYNTFTSNQYGIYIWGSSDNIIANNTISKSSNTGIYSDYYFYVANNNIIANNTIDLSTSKGIYMINSDFNNIMYNIINNTGGYSIHVQEGNLNNFINNTVYGGTAIYYSNVMLAGDKNNIYNMKANNTYFSTVENNVNIQELYDSKVPSKIDLIRYSYLNITNNVPLSYMTLNITYDDQYITGKVESTIKMWKYNTTWYELDSTLNTDENYASYYINSFSVFALAGDDIPIPPQWWETWTQIIIITFIGFIIIFSVLKGISFSQ